MLHTLRRIVQEVNSTSNLNDVLNIIVRRVKQAIGADVCSIYLIDDNASEFALMASDGLDLETAQNVRLTYGEGLVGLVAQRTDPLNLDDAQTHSRFKLFPQLNEEHLHAFVGIPITHHRKTLGVLVAQSELKDRFSEDVVNFMVTIAAQLAGSIINAQAIKIIPDIKRDIRPLSGQPGAPGVALGRAFTHTSSITLREIPDKRVQDVQTEINNFRSALKRVREDIKSISFQLLSDGMPTEDVAVFDAYLLMLDSSTFIDTTIKKIQLGNWAPGALRDTINEHIELFNEMDNPYLRERIEDIKDLGQSILNQMQDTGNFPVSNLDGGTILVAEDISATFLAELDKSVIAGIVLKKGSRTSHVAILARSMGIPTVIGVTELPISQLNGCSLIVDGYSGKVYISPTDQITKEYTRLIRQEKELTKELLELKDKPAISLDGVRIPLYANTGLVADITPSKNSGAEGIGLYRTEYPFMIRQRFPGEEEQGKIYREVLQAFAPRPVVLRTLDIGGDKALSYFPIEEDNPFLGWRGIRVTLDHPEIFMIQLRAMMIASEDLNNLNILLPMVSNSSEVENALELLDKAYHELINEGYAIKMPKLGVMVEVPSMVFQIRQITPLIDFISIGTNDLIQYLMAVDRNNANVADLYESLHPSVLKAIIQVIKDAHEGGVPVSVCGEMASDPLATVLLLGMSIDSLSTSVAALPRIKSVIRNFSQTEAANLVEQALTMKDAHAIQKLLTLKLEAKGLGGLIRAGN